MQNLIYVNTLHPMYKEIFHRGASLSCWQPLKIYLWAKDRRAKEGRKQKTKDFHDFYLFTFCLQICWFYIFLLLFLMGQLRDIFSLLFSHLARIIMIFFFGCCLFWGVVVCWYFMDYVKCGDIVKIFFWWKTLDILV